MLCQVLPLCVTQVSERRQRLAQVQLDFFNRLESPSPGQVATDTPKRCRRYPGSEVVQHQAADWGRLFGSEKHADVSTQRCADPVDLFCVEPGDQCGHGACVGSVRVVRRICEPLAASATREVGHDHAGVPFCEGTRDCIEVPP